MPTKTPAQKPAARAATKKSTKQSWLKRSFNLSSPKTKFLVFIFSFALIGGAYFAYRSFAATPACRDVVLQHGQQSECVQHMQWALMQHVGATPVNGNFSAETEKSVRFFQQSWTNRGFGWKIGAVDGKVGPKVAYMMCDENPWMMQNSAYCNRKAKTAPAPPKQPYYSTAAYSVYSSCKKGSTSTFVTVTGPVQGQTLSISAYHGASPGVGGGAPLFTDSTWVHNTSSYTKEFRKGNWKVGEFLIDMLTNGKRQRVTQKRITACYY